MKKECETNKKHSSFIIAWKKMQKQKKTKSLNPNASSISKPSTLATKYAYA
jgi:hypothetical protein